MAAVAISWLAIGLSRGRDTGLPGWGGRGRVHGARRGSGARDVPAAGYAPVYPAAGYAPVYPAAPAAPADVS
jgi:hypothetical protein